MTTHHSTTPTSALRATLPPEAVLLAPATSSAIPMRTPAETWGLGVIAVRTTTAAGAPVRLVGDAPAPDPAHTDTADLLAGVWLSAPPPADVHTGDVVVRLHVPADDDPARSDVEVLAAMKDEWRTVNRWESVDARWPHEIAMSVLVHMRYLADAALSDAQWAMLNGPIAAAMPDWFSHGLGLAGEPAVASAPRRAPDGLAELLNAGLVEAGEQVLFDGHTATIGTGGVLHHGPSEFAVSTVNALATHLSGCTVNGWHLWRRARDNRLLADLRTELATR
ncbi:hypothetical protein [Umezawaea sp. Da 62-37]|uniref:hypothetical protein n=1 Tax=Umezawaea sp. Da 62-37 TaxID=3075927 RepID=UPI0028F6ECB4|nr:hypothetical protein [Umezawaea sp. Da 62-37]WNV90202.1 hypothetical protein RM788_18490 [Umezawaea sp. Da 62-37]